MINLQWELLHSASFTATDRYGGLVMPSRPIFDNDGQFLGKRVSHRDITEQKALEWQREALIWELEQKKAQLERFTYTVSHDNDLYMSGH